MPRGRRGGLSISELERMLSQQKSALSKLEKQRAEQQRKLDAIDNEIAKLGGSGGGGRSTGRVRNGLSLIASMEAVLRGKAAMSVGDIMEAVLASGYRSNSPNFRGIVNQTLIKEKKRFSSAGRGIYQIKK